MFSDFSTYRPLVEGYPAQWSYQPGEEVAFHCSSSTSTFAVEIARITDARTVVWQRAGIPGSVQPVPPHAHRDGCDWPVTFTVTIPPDWPSGFYEVAFQADGASGVEATGHAFFVVRSAHPGRDTSILLVLGTNTYNAYNKWGGECLYTGSPAVSFARPLEPGLVVKPVDADGFDGRMAQTGSAPDPDHQRLQQYMLDHQVSFWSSSGGWWNWERRFVAWAARNGYRIDFAINRDLETNPELLRHYQLLVSVGHDEYWSWGIRDAVDQFVAAGGNVAFFSGNAVYWQVRYEDDGRKMVCHKYTARATDPVVGTDQAHLLTSIWSDPWIDRPENQTTGLSFCRGGYIRFGHGVPNSSGAYTIYQPDHWVFADTGLRYGDPLGLGSYVVTYEVDGCDFTMQNGVPEPTHSDGTPDGFTILALAPAHLLSNQPDHREIIVPLSYEIDGLGDLEYTATILFGDDSPANQAKVAHGHAVMGLFQRGGTVFNAGTTDWAYGLDGDPLVQQVTKNVLDRLSQPTVVV